MPISRSSPELFRDHPTRPGERRDPLALTDDLRDLVATAPGAARPRIGFACLWEATPERTWSYSAWNLRAGMRQVTDVADVGIETPPLARKVLKLLHARYRGRPTSTWSYSPLTEAYNARLVSQGLRRSFDGRGCDSVLMVQDVAAIPSVPYFVYSDTSYDALIASVHDARTFAAMKLITPSSLARIRDRQVAIYERAAGVIAMSRWFARSLVEHTGLPAEKVHVVHPGVSFGRAAGKPPPAGTHPADKPLVERGGPRRRLLFIGRVNHDYDFYAKGGDVVLAALAILRREHDPQITLTVAGPDNWPLPGGPPDGVEFLGSVGGDQLAGLYETHDLLVMPSRLEGFGIVFAEALTRGLPCVARDAYAMPESVTPGVSGALISNDDPHEMAEAIAKVLADDTIYESCYKRAPEIASYFSWDRAARQVARIMSLEDRIAR
jgi:glycosyltransferase involved in cell wall biosynthesis